MSNGFLWTGDHPKAAIGYHFKPAMEKWPKTLAPTGGKLASVGMGNRGRDGSPSRDGWRLLEAGRDTTQAARLGAEAPSKSGHRGANRL